MAGKQGETKRGETRRLGTLASKIQAIRAVTADIDVAEMERSAKALGALVKSSEALIELQIDEAIGGRSDALDADGEDQLRYELLRRLDALEAEIDAEGDPRAAKFNGT